jgi:hypothetical protein
VRSKRIFQSALFLLFVTLGMQAQHRPFFVTYNHSMEEKGNLEINNSNVVGSPRGGNTFLASELELEYGATGWWSTAFYLDGQSTANESTIFNGFRWENRFRVLQQDHMFNPVLYVEFIRSNEGNKALREIVGHDSEADQAEPNSITHHEMEKELETRFILSSNAKGWNIAENFIAEKPLNSEPWEFGYGFGVSRPLSFVPSAQPCNLCKENFQVGAELYGGLGDANDFGFANTSHYIAPVVSWKLMNGTAFKFSPSFGLTDESHRFLIRFGVIYEFENFGPKVASFFRK